MTSVLYSNSPKQKQQQQQKELSNNKSIQKRLYRESFEQPPLPPPPRSYYYTENGLKKHQKENIESIEFNSIGNSNDISMDEITVPQNDKLTQELLINVDSEHMDIIDECEERRAQLVKEEVESQKVEEIDEDEDEEEEEDEEIRVQDIESDFIRYQRTITQDSDSDSDDSESEDEDYSNDDSDDSDYNNSINHFSDSTIKRTANGRYIFDNNSYFYQRNQQPKQYHIYADNSLRMELIEIITTMKNNEREKPNVEEVFVHEIIL